MRGQASFSMLLLAILVFLSCAQESEIPYSWGPVDVAILGETEVNSVPLAFVSNFRRSSISILDLDNFRIYGDFSEASFLLANPIPCGRGRIINRIEVVSDGSTYIDLYVTDDKNLLLLKVPYIIYHEGEGRFMRYPLTYTEPRFHDSDSSGSNPEMVHFLAHKGKASTERWTITYDMEKARYIVEGSVSGKQEGEVMEGFIYQTDGEELEFMIDGGDSPTTDGDYFDVETFTGIEEIDAGGYIPDIINAADGLSNLLILAVIDDSTGEAEVKILDTATQEFLLSNPLIEGSIPESFSKGRMDGEFFLADSSDMNIVHRLNIEIIDEETVKLDIDPMEVLEPSMGVAPSMNPDYPYLYIAGAYSMSVTRLDLSTGTMVDFNPFLSGMDGLYLASPISGIASAPGDIYLKTVNERGIYNKSYPVIVTTYKGDLWVIEGETGCLAFDSSAMSYAEDIEFFDNGDYSDPQLEEDEDGNRIVTSACGGITRTESWYVIYDEALSNYTVEGSESGLQDRRAYENERYVSDGGEISFLIKSGVHPTTDGDYFYIYVYSGVSSIQVQSLPMNPAIFLHDSTESGEDPWYSKILKYMVIVPNAGDDNISIVDIESREIKETL